MTPPSIPDYTFRALIGEGSTGRVYAAEYGGQTLMALKAFDSESINRQLISDALVKLFNRDGHPGVVAVHDFDLASAQAYMATSLHGEPYQASDGTEAFRPRTISGLMGHLMPEDAWGYAQQIAGGLAFLHRQRVVHCNLEPSNVLLDSETPPHIKLTDFSQGLVGSVPKLIPGDSVFYAPPEQIRQPEHYFGGRAERWDVYAFGVLTYQLLTGEYPRLVKAIAEIKKREAASLDLHFSYDYRVLADMIEAQEDYEWPEPAVDDDEATRREIIDRCLLIKPEERYPDMREVMLAFQAIEDEKARQEEHRKFASEQLRLDKKVGGLKKTAAALGVLALGGLGGAAYFSQKTPAAADPSPAEPAPDRPPVIHHEPAVSDTELAELRTLLSNSMENLRESQSAFDDIFTLVIERDEEGSLRYDLPEDTRGLLLNYYEEFATQHRANPQLAMEVARAESNSGQIHLTLGDGDAGREHFDRAIAKVDLLRAKDPSDGTLNIVAARFQGFLSEARAMSGNDKGAADAALESYRLWETVHQANSGHAEATRKLAESLLTLADRMLVIERAADTGLYAQRAKTILEGLKADGKIAGKDVVALARCDHLLGKSERAKDNLGDAIDHQLLAVEHLLSLEAESVETPRWRDFTLATYYGELADVIAEFGDREKSEAANNQAIVLLRPLVKATPDNIEYPFEMARRSGTSAALLRDEGKGQLARAKLDDGIAILEDLVKVHPERYDIRHELAFYLGDLMDLYADTGMKQEVVNQGDKAVKLMHVLLNEDLDAENGGAKRAKYRDTYAELQIRFAEYLESYGQKTYALKYYEKGASQLESLIAGGDETEEITKALAAAKAKIKALGG